MITQTIRNVTASFALVGALAMPATSQEADSVQTLFETMGLPDMIQIMREEGLEYGAEIGEGLFQGRTSAEWTEAVNTIYDAQTIQDSVLSQLAEALEGEDIPAVQAFFGSALGQDIIQLEVAARRALLDDDIEAASKEAAALAMADETVRHQLITDFVDANNLVDTNVVGAMNSNFAFYMGLMEGGALGDEMSESEILTTLWGQEPEIRQNTTEWVYSFLTLAYQPLSDAQLQSYIDFSNTDAGQMINAAMFKAFDGIFEDISFALGLASTQVSLTEEL